MSSVPSVVPSHLSVNIGVYWCPFSPKDESVRRRTWLTELSEILFQLSEIQRKIPDYSVHPQPDSSISPKEGTVLMPSFEPWYKGIVRDKRMRRLFMSGMLCGVIVTAAFTYVFAIPANNYYWQTEIWKRGGAAFTFDMKSGRSTGWKWMIEAPHDTPPKKPVIVPSSQTKARTEQL